MERTGTLDWATARSSGRDSPILEDKNRIGWPLECPLKGG